MTESEEIAEAIAEAELNFHGVKVKVYQLSDGRRVISAEDMEKFFHFLAGTGEP